MENWREAVAIGACSDEMTAIMQSGKPRILYGVRSLEQRVEHQIPVLFGKWEIGGMLNPGRFNPRQKPGGLIRSLGGLRIFRGINGVWFSARRFYLSQPEYHKERAAFSGVRCRATLRVAE